MDVSGYLEFNPADRELREKNIATILAYLSCEGDERMERWRYFTEDGQGGYTGPGKYDNYDFTEDGVPGHEGLKGSDAWNCRFFPGFHFSDLKLMQTQDPNYYVVMSKGDGYIDFPAYGKKEYSNYFIHSFVMEDGRIKRYREHMNFCKVYHTLGIDLPPIEFPH